MDWYRGNISQPWQVDWQCVCRVSASYNLQYRPTGRTRENVALGENGKSKWNQQQESWCLVNSQMLRELTAELTSSWTEYFCSKEPRVLNSNMCSVNRIKSFFLPPPRGLQHSVVATAHVPFFCFMCLLCVFFPTVTFSLLGLFWAVVCVLCVFAVNVFRQCC